VHLGGIEPAQALVGQQQGGPGGQRARQLELLEPARAQRRGGGLRIGGQADQGQDVLGMVARLRLEEIWPAGGDSQLRL